MSAISLLKFHGNFSFTEFVAIVLLVVLVITPIYILWAAIKFRRSTAGDFDEEEKEEVKLKYAKLFTNLWQNQLSSLLYNVLFMIRRLLIIMTLTLLIKYPNLQVWFYLIASSFSLQYLIHKRPFDSWMLNFTEKVNEGFIFVVGYHLFGFTNLVTDLED